METVAPNICLLHPAIFKVRGKGLTQEAQVLKPCMFPRKVCLQDWPLASSWEMNSEPLEYSGWFKNKQKNKKLLWFVCLGPWAARYHFDRIVYANSVVCGEWLFLLWEAGVWIAKLSHRGASYICDCWPPTPHLETNLDEKALVSCPRWQHFAYVPSIVAGRIQRITVTPLGKDTSKLRPGFP